MDLLDLILCSALADALKIDEGCSFADDVKKEAEKSKKTAINQHIDEEIIRRNKSIINNSHLVYKKDETILVYNGKVYKSKPEKGEKYDKEKGAMSCLLKALGISTTDIINLMNK